MPLRFLLVADERTHRRLQSSGISSGSCQVHAVSSIGAVDALLQQHGFHAACVDSRMLEESPAAVVDLLRRRVPKMPILLLLPEGERRSVSQMKGIRTDAQLSAPFTIEDMRTAMESLAAREAQTVSVTSTQHVDAPLVAPAIPQIVARDEVARRMFEIALRAAPSSVSILILGETGTGKNVLAQTIHGRSALKNKPFVTVSCPSLNRELLESDLFGHVRGAFTGAVQDTWGKVAAAEGGTLFLDEIGDLPLSLQPKLLRLLQEKQYERVGETTPRNANVRILAATNRDLKAEVTAGRFREDLYYRLNVITLEVPPLRMRPADIMAAADIFLDSICRELAKRRPSFAAETRTLLEGYSWPGNLRELRNAVERAAVLSDSPTLFPRDFPGVRHAEDQAPRFQVGAPVSLLALETAHIQQVVANTPTLEEAARILQIDKSTLYRKRRAMDARLEHFPPHDERVVAISS